MGSTVILTDAKICQCIFVSNFLGSLHPYLASEICSRVIEEYDVSTEQCETDILNLLQQLQEHDLIQVVEESG
ncbi:MAG: PqqD family protein [Anaerolineales bacterium]|nr:PqqD family protein [Anaerolineales bacterium]